MRKVFKRRKVSKRKVLRANTKNLYLNNPKSPNSPKKVRPKRRQSSVRNDGGRRRRN